MRYGRTDVAEAAAILFDQWGQAATAIGPGPDWDEVTDLATYIHAWNEAHAWNAARDQATEDHWFALSFGLGGQLVAEDRYQAPDLRAAWRAGLRWLDGEEPFEFDRVNVECTQRCWDCLTCSHERVTDIRQLAAAFFPTSRDPLTGPAPAQLLRPVLDQVPAGAVG